MFDLTRVENKDVEDIGSVHPLPKGHPPLNTFAGVMGLLNTDRVNLTAELGESPVISFSSRVGMPKS